MKLFSMLYFDKVRVEVGAGTIHGCIEQVIQLAKMLECDVEFEFNERPLVAHPYSTKEELLEAYLQATG